MFLGLDCGGSKTRAIAIDSNSNVIFEGSSGPANWATTPREEIEQHLAESVRGASTIGAACGCFAGLLTEADRLEAESILKRITGSPKVECRADYHAALAACPPETTVCVIAGTGSLVCSYDRGNVVKSGGGGPWFGDHGSAFGIVRTAIGELLKRAGSNVLFAIVDEQGKTSEFYARLLAHYNAEDLSTVVSKLYERKESAGVLARFADSIVQDFNFDAPYAELALASELDQLADTIRWHLRAYHQDITQPTIALVGGLWDISPILEEQFLMPSLQMTMPNYTPLLIHPTDPPALGAARLAQQMI